MLMKRAWLRRNHLTIEKGEGIKMEYSVEVKKNRLGKNFLTLIVNGVKVMSYVADEYSMMVSDMVTVEDEKHFHQVTKANTK